jgi:hypothetical protein
MIIENFHVNARKVAGSVMPVSVLAAGVSSATSSSYMNNSFGPPQNSFGTSFLQQPVARYKKKRNFHLFI